MKNPFCWIFDLLCPFLQNTGMKVIRTLLFKCIFSCRFLLPAKSFVLYFNELVQVWFLHLVDIKSMLTESQKGWGWKGPLEVSGPTPLLKEGHLKLIAQDHVQMAFEHLQGVRLHNLSGQPVPVLCDPHSKKVFPHVQREPPVFQFVPHCLWCCHWAPLKRAWFLPLCTPPSCIYIHWGYPSKLSLLQAEQSQLSQPLLMCEMLLPSGSLIWLLEPNLRRSSGLCQLYGSHGRTGADHCLFSF